MDLFKLFGTIAIDNEEANQKLKATGKEGEKAEDKLSKLANGAAKVGKGIATGLTAGAAAIATLGGFALNAYAEYEQLAGGAELLFGEAYGYIAEEAKKAYQTVQMSQNEYLQQVNGFSTGLKTALGGNEQAAAELAHRIVVAEADIIAATGNSAENVQNAFNGIMKSNFTMLDNLQLGITPTKEGFQEVIDKVNEWNAANGKAAKYQIDNLADCQAALIDYIEMQGLSGYAMNEASGTIQGSLAMTKSAWENLLTGLADPSQNLTDLIGKLVESATTLAGNVIPVISEILVGIATAVQALTPTLSAEIPKIFNDLLPPLIAGSVSLIEGLVSALPEVFSAIIAAAPQLIEAVKQVFDVLIASLPQIIDMIADALPTLIPALVDGVSGMIMSLAEQLPTILQALIAALPKIFSALLLTLKMLFSSLIDSIKNLFTPIVEWFGNLWSSLGTVPGLAQLKTMIEAVFGTIKTHISTVMGVILNIISTNWNAIKSVVTTVINSIKNVISTVWNAIKTIISNVMKLITGILKGDWEGVKSAVFNILNAIKSVVQSVWVAIKNIISTCISGIKNTVSNGFNGIKTIISSVLNTVKNVVTSVWNGIKSVFFNSISGIRTTVVTGFRELSAEMTSVGRNVVSGIWKGITNAKDWLLNKIKGFAKTITQGIKDFFGIKSPAKETIPVGEEFVNGIIKGIVNNTENAEKTTEELGQLILDAAQKKLDNYKVYNDLTLADEAEFWELIRQNFVEGTDARINADKKYFEAKKSINEKILSAEEQLQKDLEATYSKITDKTNELFNATSYDEYTPFSEMEQDIRKEIRALDNWDKAIAELEKKIGGSKLLEDIKSKGISGALNKAYELAFNISDEDLQYYNSLYDKKFAKAQGMAFDEAYEEFVSGIATAYQAYFTECKSLGIDTTTEVEGMGLTMQASIVDALGKIALAFESFEPKMKLPHFNIIGDFSVNPPSVPEFNIEWYAKAMDNATILEKPTIFGYSQNSGALLGGGEAGSEVVAGTKTLMNMIKKAVSTQNADITALLSKILSAVIELNKGMTSNLRNALEDLSLELNNREFARLVKAVLL